MEEFIYINDDISYKLIETYCKKKEEIIYINEDISYKYKLIESYDRIYDDICANLYITYIINNNNIETNKLIIYISKIIEKVEDRINMQQNQKEYSNKLIYNYKDCKSFKFDILQNNKIKILRYPFTDKYINLFIKK